jgi:hypothetical protein
MPYFIRGRLAVDNLSCSLIEIVTPACAPAIKSSRKAMIRLVFQILKRSLASPRRKKTAFQRMPGYHGSDLQQTQSLAEHARIHALAQVSKTSLVLLVCAVFSKVIPYPQGAPAGIGIDECRNFSHLAARHPVKNRVPDMHFIWRLIHTQSSSNTTLCSSMFLSLYQSLKIMSTIFPSAFTATGK